MPPRPSSPSTRYRPASSTGPTAAEAVTASLTRGTPTRSGLISLNPTRAGFAGHLGPQPRQCLIARRVKDDPVRPLPRRLLDRLLELRVVEVQLHELGVPLGVLRDDVVEPVVGDLAEPLLVIGQRHLLHRHVPDQAGHLLHD